MRPAATLSWEPSTSSDDLAGYRVYWRLTDSPTWDHSQWVGEVTEHTFRGLVIDNYFFGVTSVGGNGHEGPVVFPSPAARRRPPRTQ